MSEFYSEGDTLILSERSEIIIQRCAVEESSEFHRHSFIEIAYVESGRGVHEIADGFVSEIEKGDLVLFNAGVAHRYKVTKPESLVVYNCLFDPAVLDESVSKSDDFINIVYSFLFGPAAAQGGEPKPYIVLKNAGSVEWIVKEMYAEYRAKQSGYSKVNAANLTRLLISVFRLKLGGRDGSADAYRKAVTESAVNYMKEFYAEKISCETLASRAYLSTGYFHRVFKETAGETPVRYLQNIRLEHAAAMLSENGLPVQTVAESVGYSDMKYFYRIFRDKYGSTPAEFRKKRNADKKRVEGRS